MHNKEIDKKIKGIALEIDRVSRSVPKRICNKKSAGITTLEIYETDGIHRYNQPTDTKMYRVGGVKEFPRVKYSRGSQVLEIEIG